MSYFCYKNHNILEYASVPLQVTAVLEGKLTEQEVRDNIRPVFYMRLRLGEFDPPEMNPYTQIPMSVILSKEHRELATRAAVKSFVLLKNLKNYLPIRKKYGRVAVSVYA